MPRSQTLRSPSPYAVLGVTPADDFATIRAAWRRLVKRWHPDVCKAAPDEAVRRLTAVNDAFDSLSVIHKRRQPAGERPDCAARDQSASRREAAPGMRQPRPDPQPAPARTAPPRTATAPGSGPRQTADARPQPHPPRRVPRHPAQDHFAIARGMFSAPPTARVQAFA
ncbi:J domain-containing protein [Thalassococcus sp. CAU 1522]|uniref:J domain-containing protein n=1 Tax=Thalassococcus arenae TaxID=2851652 RepID=A0ABS6N4I3_9RHOB|nr:J domain-containing protein [Thalassococcus arenae]MBV2358926.1 J domain-containing protein [Thalassococcus arenae]